MPSRKKRKPPDDELLGRDTKTFTIQNDDWPLIFRRPRGDVCYEEMYLLGHLIRHRKRVWKSLHPTDKKRNRFSFSVRVMERYTHVAGRKQTDILNKLKARGYIKFYNDKLRWRKLEDGTWVERARQDDVRWIEIDDDALLRDLRTARNERNTQ